MKSPTKNTGGKGSAKKLDLDKNQQTLDEHYFGRDSKNKHLQSKDKDKKKTDTK